GRGGARSTPDGRAPIVRDVPPRHASAPGAAGPDDEPGSHHRGRAQDRLLPKTSPPGLGGAGDGAPAPRRRRRPPGTGLLRGGGNDRRVRGSTVGIEVRMKRYVLWVPVVLLATGCGYNRIQELDER